jgi:hypothetical protein
MRRSVPVMLRFGMYTTSIVTASVVVNVQYRCDSAAEAALGV